MTGAGAGQAAGTTLAARVARGDRQALAEAISLVENDRDSAGQLLQEIKPHAGTPAQTVGVTGPPGAGKSTLIGALTSELLTAGRRIGVLMVDPSSPLTGGAVLADRVRLHGQTHPDLYVRSIGSRGQAGGLSAATDRLIDLLVAWGAGMVLIETVGAGQGDVDVCRIVDSTVVVHPPGLGDDLQAMKAGLMEIADVFVVNKADRPGASETIASLGAAGPGGRGHNRRRVLSTVASTGEGVPELVQELDRLAGEPRSAPVARAVAVRVGGVGAFSLAGRTAVVTGATGGLGRRFAEVLHEAGANVVLAGRRVDRLSELTARLSRSLAVPCDVAASDDRAELIAATLSAFGSLDVLVNNAGVSGSPVPAEDQPWERWERTVAVNLSGLFGLTQLAGRQMLAQGSGSIINIASVFGLVAAAPVTDAAYTASKGAVINLTRELAVEWATRGVRVNAIAPGWFPSEMTASMTDDDASQRYIQRSCPMQRMGREHELDGALLFLASDASSYCTGQTLTIDGGWTAR